MKTSWAVSVIVLFGVVIGGYSIFNRIFPKAEPINCPNAETITSISLTQNINGSVAVETTEYDTLLQNIRASRPTRKMSVNDHPTAKTYYIIEIETTAREYRYFLYEENSQVYIEIPYEGIYRANKQGLDFVAECFMD